MSDEVRRVKRLQVLTFLAILATAGLLVWDRVTRPGAAADPRIAPLEETSRQTRAELASLSAQVARTPGEVGDLRRALQVLRDAQKSEAKQLAALRGRVQALEARKPRRQVALLEEERWVLFRFRKLDGRPLEVAQVRLDSGARAGFGDDGGGKLSYRSLRGQKIVRLPLATSLAKRSFAEGVLFVSVAVQTDNGIEQKRGVANRIWLEAGEQKQPVFAHFFKGDDRNPSDPVLKTASNSVALRVLPGTKLALALDAEVFSRQLRTTETGPDRRGRFDVLLRLGPAILHAKGDR